MTDPRTHGSIPDAAETRHPAVAPDNPTVETRPARRQEAAAVPDPAAAPHGRTGPGPAASSSADRIPESNQSLADRAREATPTAAQTIVPRRQSIPPGRRALWWAVCLFPFLAAFVLQWLPALNGPHLFLGIPVIMWWTCIPCSLLTCLFLCIVEFTRTDQDREEVLDLLASRVGDERRVAARAAARAGSGSGDPLAATGTRPAPRAPEEAP